MNLAQTQVVKDCVYEAIRNSQARPEGDKLWYSIEENGDAQENWKLNGSHQNRPNYVGTVLEFQNSSYCESLMILIYTTYIIILYTYMNYDISYILMYNTVPESTTNLAAKTLQLTSIYTKHLSAPGSMGGLWHSTLAWNFSSFRLPVGAGNFGLKYPQTVVGVMFISPSHSSFQAEYHQQSQWPLSSASSSTLKSHHFQ